MPIVRVRTPLAIGASIENLLTGSQFEILPGTANIWHVAFAFISDVASVFGDVVSGTDILMENGEISDANRWPTEDDFDLFDIVAAGERLKVRMRNENVAAAVIKTVLKITPAG